MTQELAPTAMLSTSTFTTGTLRGPSAQLTLAGTELARHIRNGTHTWDAGLQTAIVDFIAVRPWTPAEFRGQLRAIHAPDVEAHFYPSSDTERSLLVQVQQDAHEALNAIPEAVSGAATAARWTAIAIGVAWVVGLLFAAWVVIQIVRGLAPHSGQIALKAAGGS